MLTGVSSWLQAVAVVRLLLMPAVTLALVRGLAALRLLPADPVCALTLLVQVRRGTFREF